MTKHADCLRQLQWADRNCCSRWLSQTALMSSTWSHQWDICTSRATVAVNWMFRTFVTSPPDV